MAMAPTAFVVFLWSLAFGYSFGGDVRVPQDIDRPVRLTSFGGDIDVPQAPRGARIRSFGGDVRMGKVAGQVQASSYGGTIDIASLRGDARLTSFGGKVDVSVARDDLAGKSLGHAREITIRSFGGEVIVHLPHEFNGTIDVRARCRPGHEQRCGIDGDFALKESRRSLRSFGFLLRRREELRASAKLGDGRNRVTILLEEATAVLRRD